MVDSENLLLRARAYKGKRLGKPYAELTNEDISKIVDELLKGSEEFLASTLDFPK